MPVLVSGRVREEDDPGDHEGEDRAAVAACEGRDSEKPRERDGLREEPPPPRPEDELEEDSRAREREPVGDLHELARVRVGMEVVGRPPGSPEAGRVICPEEKGGPEPSDDEPARSLPFLQQDEGAERGDDERGVVVADDGERRERPGQTQLSPLEDERERPREAADDERVRVEPRREGERNRPERVSDRGERRVLLARPEGARSPAHADSSERERHGGSDHREQPDLRASPLEPAELERQEREREPRSAPRVEMPVREGRVDRVRVIGVDREPPVAHGPEEVERAVLVVLRDRRRQDEREQEHGGT